MNAADRQRIYVEGLAAKIHLLEQSVATQRSELERRAAAIGALEEQQRALILRTHSADAEIACLRVALKPFAEYARIFVGRADRAGTKDDVAVVGANDATLTLGDMRAAIKALE